MKCLLRVTPCDKVVKSETGSVEEQSKIFFGEMRSDGVELEGPVPGFFGLGSLELVVRPVRDEGCAKRGIS